MLCFYSCSKEIKIVIANVVIANCMFLLYFFMNVCTYRIKD